MLRWSPKLGPGPLARRVGPGFEFVGELIELVEIDSGPEPERVRNGLRRGVPTWLRLLAETGAEGTVDDVLERQPKFARPPLQESGQIVVDGECCAHGSIIDAMRCDVKKSQDRFKEGSLR
jgi:hypothetical protein